MAKKNRRIPMFTWGFFYGTLASKDTTPKLRIFTFSMMEENVDLS
jgi:hypothetical protein